MGNCPPSHFTTTQLPPMSRDGTAGGDVKKKVEKRRELTKNGKLSKAVIKILYVWYGWGGGG